MSANFFEDEKEDIQKRISFISYEGFESSFDYAASEAKSVVRKHLLVFLIPGLLGLGLLLMSLVMLLPVLKAQASPSAAVEIYAVVVQLVSLALIYTFSFSGAGLLFWSKKRGKPGGFKVAAAQLVKNLGNNLALSAVFVGFLSIVYFLLIVIASMALALFGDSDQVIEDKVLGWVVFPAALLSFLLSGFLHGFLQFAGCLINLGGHGVKSALKRSWRLTRSKPRRAMGFGLFHLGLLLLNSFTCSLLFPYLASVAGASTYAAFYQITGFEREEREADVFGQPGEEEFS